jgi:hypothetical protein
MNKAAIVSAKDADQIQGLIDLFHLKNVGEEVYDPATKERILVTPQRIIQASMLLMAYAQAEQTRWILAYQARENRLWAECGCTSFEDFAEKRLHINARQGRTLARRGERRMLLINAAGSSGDKMEAALDGQSKSDQVALYDLPQEIFAEELAKVEELFTDMNGQDWTPEELAAKFTKDVSTQNKSLKKALSQAQEEKLTAESERDHLQKLVGQDAGEIGALTLKIGKLKEQLDQAKRRESMESASHERMTAIMGEIRGALQVFRAYVGRDDELDQDDRRELAMEAAGMMAQLAGEARDISRMITEQFDNEVAKPAGRKR